MTSWVQRVDLVRITTELGHGFSHGREVDDGRHAGEVLHDDTGGGELDLDAGLGLRLPAHEGADVIGGDVGAVLGPKQVFEQDLQAVRQPGDLAGRADPVDLVGGAADLEGSLGAEAVNGAGHTDHPLVLSGCCSYSFH
jgi:hypothetical protein